jgi:primosomal protein N' (replication factor Y)
VRTVAVAVPVPLLDALTYAVPDGMPWPAIGARVRVPVGPRVLTGCVISRSEDEPPPGVSVKPLREIVDEAPFLPAPVVELCAWVADYYLAGIGDAIGVALPPGARDRSSGYKTRRVFALTAHGLAAIDAADAGLTEKQQAALRAIAGSTGLSSRELRGRGVSAAVLARLTARQLVASRDEPDERDPFARAAAMDTVVHDATRALTEEQTAAFAALHELAATGEFKVALLHGVTGSGKTEIYMRLAQAVCRAGRRVLLLVPEIALTPSVAAVVRGAFGDRVAIQHSSLSDGERHDQWQRIRKGEVDIIVGTRSAVFAPVERLGLIIVDEEHDPSYKQEEAPRYHGRDVAIVRAQREGALVVLGSATPSMESFQHAESGKYARVTLSRRVLDRPLAEVRVVNMREEYAEQGPEVVVSRALVEAIEERLTRREQVLVLLNRRGYATAVFCRQCGDTFECPNCSISLTVHTARQGWRARCHYCNYSVAVPKTCRKCAAPYLEQSGFGTEKVEQQLAERFPAARVARVDRDSVRKRGALTSLLSRFAAGEIDLLVGTQMIAKGHDFPRVTLVGVISADVGLGMADFRAGERTFQLLTQVAGRAGRGERTGEAIVQTLYPEHYSVQLACRQDYQAFFTREIEYRKGLRYPPYVALVNAVVRGRTFDEAMQTAQEIASRLAGLATAGGFVVMGPAPAPLTRLRGEHRVQIFLKGVRRGEMRQAMRSVLAAMPEARRRVVVDVDPLNVL